MPRKRASPQVRDGDRKTLAKLQRDLLQQLPDECRRSGCIRAPHLKDVDLCQPSSKRVSGRRARGSKHELRKHGKVGLCERRHKPGAPRETGEVCRSLQQPPSARVNGRLVTPVERVEDAGAENGRAIPSTASSDAQVGQRVLSPQPQKQTVDVERERDPGMHLYAEQVLPPCIRGDTRASCRYILRLVGIEGLLFRVGAHLADERSTWRASLQCRGVGNSSRGLDHCPQRHGGETQE